MMPLTLTNLVVSLAGGHGQASEALPSPTVFVVVYAAMWLLLVAWIAWLAMGQHRLDVESQKIHRQLQAQLDHHESRPSPTQPSPDA